MRVPGRNIGSPLDSLGIAVSSESGGIIRTGPVGTKLGGKLLNMQEVISNKKVGPEALETLLLFAEKADRLGELSLVDEVMKKLSGTAKWVDGEGWSDEYIGPNGESVEAFVLTLRLFIQDNERISLQNMSRLYKELPLGSSLSERFEQQRTELNGFLDTETNLSIVEGKLTYREIFDIFLYGSLAHTDPQKRRIFTDLRSGAWFGLFQLHFAECLRAFVLALHSMRPINAAAVEQLREEL